MVQQPAARVAADPELLLVVLVAGEEPQEALPRVAMEAEVAEELLAGFAWYFC